LQSHEFIQIVGLVACGFEQPRHCIVTDPQISMHENILPALVVLAVIVYVLYSVINSSKSL
jgi:hypothetical protein